MDDSNTNAPFDLQEVEFSSPKLRRRSSLVQSQKRLLTLINKALEDAEKSKSPAVKESTISIIKELLVIYNANQRILNEMLDEVEGRSR